MKSTYSLEQNADSLTSQYSLSEKKQLNETEEEESEEQEPTQQAPEETEEEASEEQETQQQAPEETEEEASEEQETQQQAPEETEEGTKKEASEEEQTQQALTEAQQSVVEDEIEEEEQSQQSPDETEEEERPEQSPDETEEEEPVEEQQKGNKMDNLLVETTNSDLESSTPSSLSSENIDTLKFTENPIEETSENYTKDMEITEKKIFDFSKPINKNVEIKFNPNDYPEIFSAA